MQLSIYFFLIYCKVVIRVSFQLSEKIGTNQDDEKNDVIHRMRMRYRFEPAIFASAPCYQVLGVHVVKSPRAFVVIERERKKETGADI